MTEGKTALYRHFDKDGNLLYVGVSLSAVARLSSHYRGSPWADQISSVTVEYLPTRPEALHAERKAIKAERPRWNTHHAGNSTIAADIDEYGDDREAARLISRSVTFRPFYSAADAAQTLCISQQALRGLIESGRISAVVMSRHTVVRDGKEIERIRYGITGWQMIAYLEWLEDNSGISYGQDNAG